MKPAKQLERFVYATFAIIFGAFNLLTLLVGVPLVLLMLVGLVLSENKFSMWDAMYTMIMCTSIFIVAPFYGVHGTLKRSAKSLGEFNILTVFFVVLEVGFLLLLGAPRLDFSMFDNEKSTKRLVEAYDFGAGHANSVDSIQQAFSCCGVHSPNDWLKFNSSVPNAYPKSCCPKPEFSEQAGDASKLIGTCKTQIFPTGCIQMAKEQLPGELVRIKLVWALVMSTAVAMSYYMACYIKRNSRPTGERAKSELSEAGEFLSAA